MEGRMGDGRIMVGQGKLLTSAVPSTKPWRMAPTEKEEEGAIVPVMRWRGRA